MSGEMLGKLVPDIQRTAALVQEIAAASKEQDTGADQINKALQELEQVIQQNASASEQMAATTEQLTGQSDQPVSALSFFRTAELGRQATVRTAATASVHRVESVPVKVAVGSSHAGGLGMKAITRGGVSLQLKDKHDDLDGDFERF
jgi:methyl-accepting chemotaxis protein